MGSPEPGSAPPPAPDAPAARSPVLRGIALMMFAVAVFATMDTTAKYLSRFYPVPGIVWARYAVNLLLLVAFLVATRRWHVMRTQRPGIQVLRGILLGSATMLFFLSLTRLPIADATAIGFVMPLFIALLAVPMLKERMDGPRMAAILAGLAGALIIVRPGASVFTPYALLPLAMAAVNSLYHILTRKIAGLEPPLTSLFYGALVGAVMFAPVVPFRFEPPDTAFHWLLLGLLGGLATIGHLALIRAYDCAPATVLAPYQYSILLWVMLSGYLVFGDFPDGWSIAGMAVIVLAGLYVANRQRLTMRRS